MTNLKIINPCYNNIKKILKKKKKNFKKKKFK